MSSLPLSRGEFQALPSLFARWKSATLIRTVIPSVSRTNYTASHSRMTNGTVQKQGTSVVVQYRNGAQTISVPSNVEVTQIVPKKETLAVGDAVYVAADKQADGSLTTNKVYLIAAR